jgi:thiol-disulfide isomerase/thioredoxin
MTTRRTVAALAALTIGIAVAWAEAPAVRAVTPEEFSTELAAHRGRVVMLNVWATWCVPCLKEIPDLLRVEAELRKDGLVLLGLSIDDPADAAAVDAFRQKYFAGFRTLMRASGNADALVSVVDPAWNEVVPTTYLIGRNGRVVSRIQGKKTFGEFRDAAGAAVSARAP